MVGQRTAGFTASMVSAFDKATGKYQSQKLSCHVGQIGDRGEFELVLKNKYSGVSAYGSYDRYTFHDPNGNVMVWTTSSQLDLEVNKKYRIKGMIKDHSEYKNVEQTIINNCKIMVSYD